MATQNAFTGRPGLVLPAILLVAFGLRLPGLFTDFWLDEIWTLKIVYRMESWADVFTTVRHSNNHHLNTLYYYALVEVFGEPDHWSVFRLHSLAASVASVWLAFRIAARRGQTEAVLAALLCATSYLQIHFASEARGYAMLVFFALSGFALARRFAERPGWATATLFSICSILGFLSHLMYLQVFAALAVWMTVTLHRRSRDEARGPSLGARLGQLFAAPACFVTWLYFFDIRATKIGEGPEFEPAAVFVKALSYALGGPPSGVIAVFAAATAVALFGAATLWHFRRGRDEWLWFALVIFISPATLFAVMQPEVFFVRYALLSAVFGLLALAGPLTEAWKRGGAGRAAAALLLALVMLGNALDLERFYRYGRGGYLDAMRFMALQSGELAPTVAGDHRFRNHNVIRFYNRYLPESQRMIYLDQKDYPEWLVLHRINELGPVDAALVDGQGHAYEHKLTAPYADLSGWHWLVYRRLDR